MNYDIIEYLDNVDFDDFEIKYKEFDVILGGGGFKGYYHLGLFKILKHYEKYDKIKIRHMIGTSTGAISAIFYLCNIDFNDWINCFYEIKEHMHKTDLNRTVVRLLTDLLPENGYELCNNKLKIMTSKINSFWFC